MNFFNWLFGNRTTYNTPDSSPKINPASGLPMIDDTAFDVGGNAFGTSDWASDSSYGSSDCFSSSTFDS